MFINSAILNHSAPNEFAPNKGTMEFVAEQELATVADDVAAVSVWFLTLAEAQALVDANTRQSEILLSETLDPTDWTNLLAKKANSDISAVPGPSATTFTRIAPGDGVSDLHPLS